MRDLHREVQTSTSLSQFSDTQSLGSHKQITADSSLCSAVTDGEEMILEDKGKPGEKQTNWRWTDMKEKRLSSQTNEPGREWQRTGIESRKVVEAAWYLGNKICTCDWLFSKVRMVFI